jgi:hypothetical protein
VEAHRHLEVARGRALALDARHDPGRRVEAVRPGDEDEAVLPPQPEIRGVPPVERRARVLRAEDLEERGAGDAAATSLQNAS